MPNSDTPPSMPKLGNYELLMLLASGGMANVYAARQVGAAGFERLVVIKRVHAHLLQDRDFYDMFRDEAALASLVRHPNVVPVTDVIESAGELFLVMDYVDGVALSTVLKAAKAKGARIPPRVVIRMVADTLAGLHAAHEVHDMRGNKLELVHRDVSPHNILVGADGIARLIDFGVAKAAHRSTQTRSGALKGKYPYMSPEHARGGEIDRRSDLFAAAAVLHEALTGKRLFQGSNDLDTLRRVMEAPIPDVATDAKAMPHSVDVMLHKALARNAAERYQTAQDFLEALERALPPASHREVRAVVLALCDDRLTERRTALQSLLEGKVAPLSIRQARPEDGSGSQRALPSSALAPTAVEVPQRVSQSSPSKSTQITHDAPIVPPPASSARGRVLAVVGLSAAMVGAVLVWAIRSKEPAAPATASSGVPPVTSVPAQPGPPSNEVEIVLVADLPIQSVRAPGARDIAVDGTRAKLHLTRWTGILSIDAVLAGGVLAHATALEGSVGEVRLERVVVDAGRAASTRPKPPPPPPPSQPSEDLHGNPYGP